MTDLRTAALAQQAEPVAYTTGHCENHKQKGGCQLHNLQCGWPDCDRKPSAAPPQQAEPVEGNTLLRDFLAAAKEAGVTHIRQVEADLCSALAQQAEPVEPAAKAELMMTGGNAGLATRIVEIDHHLRERLRPGQLLYTAPPQRKPLDDLAIADIYTKWDATPGVSMADFARAVERAHGIGRQSDPQIEDRLARHGIPKP